MLMDMIHLLRKRIGLVPPCLHRLLTPHSTTTPLMAATLPRRLSPPRDSLLLSLPLHQPLPHTLQLSPLRLPVPPRPPPPATRLRPPPAGPPSTFFPHHRAPTPHRSCRRVRRRVPRRVPPPAPLLAHRRLPPMTPASPSLWHVSTKRHVHASSFWASVQRMMLSHQPCCLLERSKEISLCSTPPQTGSLSTLSFATTMIPFAAL